MQKFTGLSESEVVASRERHGANIMAPLPHVPAWKLFLEKFKDPVIIILIAATLISAFTGGWVESLGILLAIMLATGIGFVSEYRAGQAFDVLNKTEDSTPVKVIRDGVLGFRPKTELVVGDIIFVETGDEAPADAEVLAAADCHVDQSKFTGEPEPVMKTPAAENADDEGTYPVNVVLRGSTVLTGNAHLRVTAVGNATEIGKTAHAATEITDGTTPLQKQLGKLSKVIASVGFSLAVLLCGILLFQAWHGGGGITLHVIMGILMVSITLIVVVVPEGLPMSVTLSLAMSFRRMAANNVLIRKLHACETIGAATVICTDKTGTLTMNQMRVVKVDFPDENLLEEAFCVNATAGLNSGEVVGNPTEGALLLYILSRGGNYLDVRATFTVREQHPFSTQRKFMATCGVSPRCANSVVTYFKGAPEILLGRCTRQAGADGKLTELTPSRREELLGAFKAEQDNGCRTLGFALCDGECSPDEAGELIYLGFAAIADPVRPEVPAAIAECKKAGIEVKIVTGDTVATAMEIGRQIGLNSQVTVLEGRAFEALSPEETERTVPGLNIIARARPNDKMKLVKALQKKGGVVAVTGDGTNDAPALHHADVGIAMGRCGTAIAREASDIILLDDSFPSIVTAVLWGRSLYLNIQRFLVFQLTINMAAAGIALAGPFFGVAMPLTVIQMLWINLIMDTFAALALASEPPTPEVMSVPPRNPAAFIITPMMGRQIFLTAIFFMLIFFGALLWWREGGISRRELTLIFSGFVMLQFWNLLNVRVMGTVKSVFSGKGQDNQLFYWILAGIAAGQVLITQFGGEVFRTEPLGLADWCGIFGITSVILWLGELRRMWQRIRGNEQK